MTVTNIIENTNTALAMRLALPGMVEAWGDDYNAIGTVLRPLQT